MNKYNRAALNNFLDHDNGVYLKSLLNNHFKNPRVYTYLENTFAKHHQSHALAFEREFVATDKINRKYNDDQDVARQVKCMNLEFIEQMKDFISVDILALERREQLAGNRTIFVNDGLKANSGSVVAPLPRSRLIDTDTCDVDDPAIAHGYATRTARVHKDLTGDAMRFRRGLNTSVTSKMDRAKSAKGQTADDCLDRQKYAHRAPQIRDDAVGEIVRDRWMPCSAGCTKAPDCPGCKFDKKFCGGSERPRFHNQQEFPYGNPTMNPAQTRSGPTYNYRTGRSRDSEQIETQQGNSLCSFDVANIASGQGFSYEGVPDTLENGAYENKFSGESAEYSGDHVDRLLSTPYIQTLNRQRGELPMECALLTTYQRGQRGAMDPEIEGMKYGDPQRQKLWHDGDGFEDQSNPAAMAHLMNRRVFRNFNKAPACRACAASKVCIKHPRGAAHATDMTSSERGDTADEQIPFYERALHNRHYDRDADESLGGFETDCLNRGYGADMMSMYCRVPNQTPCGQRKYPMPGGYRNQTGAPEWKFLAP